nr:ankyrin repeat domain-containing protein [candidate division Zixibacteria bacterium]
MNRSISIAGLALIIMALIPAAHTAAATDFSGDLTIAQGKDTLIGNIKVSDEFYKMDFTPSGQPIIVIVDRTKSVTHVYNTQEKQFREMGSQDQTSLMNDPFQSAVYTASIAKKESLGIEKIGQQECDKFKYSSSGQDIMIVWIAREFNFPIKIQNLVMADYSAKITNIKTGKIDRAEFKGPEGYTPFSESSSGGSQDIDIVNAAGMGNIEVIKKHLDAGVDINFDSGDGYTPLLMAAMYGRDKAVKFLVEAGADVNLVTGTGQSAILAASQYGKTEIVKMLVEAGADVNMVYGSGSTTILREAIKYGHVDLVKYLIEAGADTRFKNAQGEPLMSVANKSDAKMMEVLKAAGID